VAINPAARWVFWADWFFRAFLPRGAILCPDSAVSSTFFAGIAGWVKSANWAKFGVKDYCKHIQYD
jgi:hypothetical protein